MIDFFLTKIDTIFFFYTNTGQHLNPVSFGIFFGFILAVVSEYEPLPLVS